MAGQNLWEKAPFRVSSTPGRVSTFCLHPSPWHIQLVPIPQVMTSTAVTPAFWWPLVDHQIFLAVSLACSPLIFCRIFFLSSLSVASLYWVASSSSQSWRALGLIWRYASSAAFRCHLACSRVTLSGARTPTAFTSYFICDRLRRFPCFRATTMFQSLSLPPRVLRWLK